MLNLVTISTLLAATAQAAPAVGNFLKVPGGVIGFDPKYVHVPRVDEIFNPRVITHDVKELLGSFNATSLPGSHGTSSPDTVDKRLWYGDNRYQYTNPNAFPWRMIGKLQLSNGGYCSASLIGPRHVVTARHCLPSDGRTSMTFFPSYDNGPNPTFGGGNVQTIISNNGNGGDCGTKYDHAILIIDKRFGDGLGYFGAQYPDSSRFNQAIFTSVGYPSDRDSGNRPYRQDSTTAPNPWDRHGQLTCDSSGPFYTDNDVIPGQSGSPIWTDGGSLWGVLSALISYGDGQSIAGWASGDLLISMIGSARRDFS